MRNCERDNAMTTDPAVYPLAEVLAALDEVVDAMRPISLGPYVWSGPGDDLARQRLLRQWEQIQDEIEGGA